MGDLKRQMQLGELTQLSTRPLRLNNGAIIQAHSRFGEDGMPDMDEVWIFSQPPQQGKPKIKIIGFDIYFKEHTIYYAVESNDPLPARAIYYYVGEPYHTTGGGVVLFSEDIGGMPHDIVRSQYIYDADFSNTEDYNGSPERDDDTIFGRESWVQMYQAYFDDGVDEFNFEIYGMAAADNDGLYGVPNACFNHLMPEEFNYSTGYMGKIGMSLEKDNDFDLEIPGEVLAVQGVHTNSILTERALMTVDKADKFVNGWYAIGALNERHLDTLDESGEEHGESPNSDVGGYTIVFHLSNGDEVTHEFDFDFSFTGWPDSTHIFSNTTVLFNPVEGFIKEFELEQESNPFYRESTASPGSQVESTGVIAREIPDSIEPVKTYDVLANYRETHDIEH